MAADIKKALKQMIPHLLRARDEDLNEADTVQRLIKVFEDVLGYDAMSEITRESQVKDRFVDIAIKIDGAIRLLVEAKSAGTTLRDRHMDQAQRYAAEGNIRWVVLTNGVVWNLYHLSFEEGIDYTLVFTADLSQSDIEQPAQLLSLLHRQSVKAGRHEEFWQRRSALGPESVGRALFTEESLKLIRREIRKKEGILLDEEDLARAIHEMFSTETRERIGPLKIRRARRVRARQGSTTASPAQASAPEAILASEPKRA